MKKILLFILFVNCVAIAQRNHHKHHGKHQILVGTIANNNGEPLMGATILVDDNKYATVANDKGEYFIHDISEGKHIVQASYLGFSPEKKEIFVSKDIRSQKINCHFSLKESSESLQKVNLVGKTKKTKIETEGFAVNVIETKEASLRNLTTNELLDRSVGVRIRQNGGLGSSVEYNLNGMSGSAVGIFLDGLEISTYGQSFNLNNIPTSMIERIEVYKGVLPSHLTGDYAGGAINVVLKKDVSQNSINLASSYGSFNTSQSDIGVMLRDKNTGLAFRGSAFYTYTDNSYETWGESTTYVNYLGQIIKPYRAKRFNNTYKALGGRFEVGFTDKKWADQFFIGYNGSSNYREIPHGVTMAVPYVGRFSEAEAHVLLLNYSKNDFLTKNLSLKVNAARSYRSTYLQDTIGIAYNWDGKPREIIQEGERVILETLNGGQQGEKTITNTDRKITNMRSNLGYMITDGHRVSLNHKFEATDRNNEDLLNSTITEYATTSTISQNIVSVNYEAETFNKKLLTNLLGKHTYNHTSKTEYGIETTDGINSIEKTDTTSSNSNFGYGATLSYNVIPNLYVITSTEKAYVSPTDNQLYGAPEQNILENTQLKPEYNINYNLGFRLKTLQFNKHKISVYANLFWRNGHDKIKQEAVDASLIEEETEADIEVTRYVNLGETQAKGYEAEITYIYNNRLNTSFNFSKFNNVFKQEFDENGNPHSLYNFQVPNEPFFTINANIQYRFNNLFQKKSILNTYYTMGYVGEYYTVWGQPDWSKTPSQLSHDIGLSYRFPSKKLVASLDVKNIFNAELYDNFRIQKPGRGIYFKLNYTINKIL
ncbi:outer membrane receptor protein involved in Fe transport [Wenyingzhuangia heitensis]|uniref:Outer membrane receptor protein involved in Fe transport n=1 Tax=Wenyingzhuangia heitensis TaxID=1487859 RepID=A0ABX0U843_9FLAO|nr:TonB-dependent receptor [Wenyingzhuangia heitensis]NIJ43691.1 outer membrane receptor protein involved in Fe transport [Wenyingzhuangia heitensis]